MALALGTNCGFVSVAPTADPAGTNVPFNTCAFYIFDTAPVGATTIIEVGWYCDNATEEANYEVGLYAADGAVVPGEAGTRLQVEATNAKGIDAGWKRKTGLSWAITAGVKYGIGAQIDNTATATNGNYAAAGGAITVMKENPNITILVLAGLGVGLLLEMRRKKK